MEPEGEGQRGNGTLDGSGHMPPEGATNGAQEDVEDEDNGQHSGSLETSCDAYATEPEGTAREAVCSTDCSQPQWRIQPAERTTLGKRDSGQRDLVEEHSPKRSRTTQANDKNGRMYIDVDVPGGPKKDGPHTGDTWSPRLRGGSGSSSGALCTCNAPIKVQRAPQTDVAALTQAQDGRKNGCWPLEKRLGDKSRRLGPE